MKKIICASLMAASLITTHVAARTQQYVDLDIGYELDFVPFSVMFINGVVSVDWIESRIGFGTQYMPFNSSGFFIGLDAHFGSNINSVYAQVEEINVFESLKDHFHYQLEPFSLYSLEAQGLIGYQFRNAVELTVKLGGRYLWCNSIDEDVLIPNFGINLAIPLTQHVKLITEIDTIILCNSARAGIRYTF